MVERRSAGAWVWLVSAGIPLLGLAAGIRIGSSQADLRRGLLAAAVMATLSFVSVPTRSRIVVTPSLSAIAALPFVRASSGRPLFDLGSSLGILALGTTIIWVLRTARGDDPEQVVSASVRLLGSGAVYLSTSEFLSGALAGPTVADPNSLMANWSQVMALLVLVPLSFMADGLLATATATRVAPLSRSLLEFRDFDVYVTLIVTGALFGLTYDAIGWFALGVAGLPFFFALSAFRRLAATRLTYSQTIRALARLPEVAGHVRPGHADRVTNLAAAVARKLRMRASAVEQVEWAAYLHDIGWVSLNDPGVAKIGYTDVDVGEWGAVIAEEASLRDVATVIRRQHEPYRQPGQQPDPDLPIASRIVKVCSAYDDLVSEQAASPLEALETLHRGSVYDYDPDIVHALRVVLESTDSINSVR